MRLTTGRFVLTTASAAWLLMISVGLGLLWGYENASGQAATPPVQWPADSGIRLADDRATLIILIHPHCPCSRASIGELARLMAQAQGRVTAHALLVKPEGASDDWEKTDLLESAADIPGVDVIVDDGTEARRFNAATSGQTVLYDAGGHLLFSGGITGSRGHAGDNEGRSAIVSLLNTGAAERAESSVFGCPLFGTNSKCGESLDDRNNR